MSSEERPSLRPAAVLGREGSGQRGPVERCPSAVRPQGADPRAVFLGRLVGSEPQRRPWTCPVTPSLAPVSSVLSQCGRGGARNTQVRALTPSCLAAQAGCGEPPRLPGHVQLSAWPPSPRSCGQPCSLRPSPRSLQGRLSAGGSGTAGPVGVQPPALSVCFVNGQHRLCLRF